MARFLDRLRRFLSELRRRNVYKVAAAYAVVGWVVIQAANVILPRLQLPGWTVTLVIVLVAFGFPIALVLAWALELTPEGGVRRTQPSGTPPSGDEAAPTPAYRWMGVALLAVVLGGVWWYAGRGPLGEEAPAEAPGTGERSVAVLPFEVSGAGAETWRDGMVTVLSMNLDGAAGLRAIADRTVFAAWEERGQAEEGATVQEAVAVARGVGARYAVVGSAVQLGEDLRLGAEVREAATGERLGQVEVRGMPDSVTSLADRLTRRVLEVLLERSEDRVPSVNLASITTESLPALKAYLRGERHFRAGEYETAIEDYREAIQEDSTFALAYARLARSHGWLGEYEQSRRFWKRAYPLSGRLPERERRLVRAQHNWVVRDRVLAAADSLRRLTELYPDDPSIWYEFGEVLFHSWLPVPKFGEVRLDGWMPPSWREVEKALEQAAELDPGVASYHYHLVDLAISIRHDSTLAAERIGAMPQSKQKPLYRLAWDLLFGTEEQRRDALVQLDSLPLVPVLTLFHPTDAGLWEMAAPRISQPEFAPEGYTSILRLLLSLQHGRIAAAVREMEKSALDAKNKACFSALSMTVGVPVPDSIARPLLEPTHFEENVSLRRLRCSGYYLIEQGRTEELKHVMSRLQERVAAAVDSPAVYRFNPERALDELNGYRAFRTSELNRAAKLWSGYNWSREWGAIWRGDLYRKLGQAKKAEGWYRAAWFHPVTHERLGQLYAEMGRPEKAAAAYRRFIAAWEDADASLHDRVEAAQERLQQLTAVPSDRADS